MQYSYNDVTIAATEAIADMHAGQASDSAPRRAAGAGVYLLWAHLVGDAAQEADDKRIMDLINSIA